MDVSSSEMGSRLSYSEDISIPAEFQFERHLVAKNIFISAFLSALNLYLLVMYVCTVRQILEQMLILGHRKQSTVQKIIVQK